MIIDLILDRKDFEADDRVSVAESKFSEMYVPILSLYPADAIPAELRNGYTYHYTAAGFYREVMRYGKIGHGITAALDYGAEADVKRALCEYIDRNEYNPEIKEYVNSVQWLDED